MTTNNSQAAPNLISEALTRGGGFETQSANDYNHSFSQLLTNLSNLDKSKGSAGGSSSSTNTHKNNFSGDLCSPITRTGELRPTPPK